MPRDIPVHTQCAGPGDAKSWRQIPGLPGYLTSLIFTTGSLAGVAVFVLAIVTSVAILNNPFVWAAFILLLIIALYEVKDWYYNHRLLCIRDRDCAIGTIISEPSENFDGDHKLNLMLAPQSRCDWTSALRTHLSVNRSMLSDPANFDATFYGSGMPVLPTDAQLADFSTLKDYMSALHGKNTDEVPAESESTGNMYRQVLIGVVARLMSDPAQNFYNRFLRKDSAEIGAPGTQLWAAIPDDFDDSVQWDQPNAMSTKLADDPYSQLDDQTLNTMFRFDAPHLVPFLHAEIEGYRVGLLIDDLIVALLAILAVLIAIGFLGPLGILIAALVFFILVLLAVLVEDLSGNDGDAGNPDVDWDDPGTPGDGVPQQKGDVVLVYGNQIMDTDHYEYFEIHPIRAYYVLSHDTGMWAPDPSLGPCDGTNFSNENILQTLVDKQFADLACAIASAAEEEPPPVILLRQAPTLLSYGLTTFYAGGGAHRP